MDVPSSTPAGPPTDETDYSKAEARIVREHLKSEMTDGNKHSLNSWRYSETHCPRSRISSDVELCKCHGIYDLLNQQGVIRHFLQDPPGLPDFSVGNRDVKKLNKQKSRKAPPSRVQQERCGNDDNDEQVLWGLKDAPGPSEDASTISICIDKQGAQPPEGSVHLDDLLVVLYKLRTIQEVKQNLSMGNLESNETTYYSLESDREKAASPDSWDDDDDFEEVHDQLDEDNADIGCAGEIFTQRDVPRDISHEVILAGSSSSAESLSGWEKAHQLPRIISMSTAETPLGPNRQVEITQADEGTAECETRLSSNPVREPERVELTKEEARMTIPSPQVGDIPLGHDHRLSLDTKEQTEHRRSPSIDSGDSEEDSAKLDGKKLGDEKPSFSGDDLAGSEAQQAEKMSEPQNQRITTIGEGVPTTPPTTTQALIIHPESEELMLNTSEQDAPNDDEVIKAVQTVKNYIPNTDLKTKSLASLSTGRFFEITNVAATSGGVCQAQELTNQTGYSQRVARLGKISDDVLSEEAHRDATNTSELEQEIQVTEKEHSTDKSTPKDAYYKVEDEDPWLLVTSPDPSKSEAMEIIEADAPLIVRIKVEEKLHKTEDEASQYANPDFEDRITDKDASKRVTFSSAKSQKSIFHTQPKFFPLTELHKWPVDMSNKQITEEIIIEEEGLNDDEDLHNLNYIELTPIRSPTSTTMKTERIDLNGLNLPLADGDQSNPKNVEGVDNPTFVMDESNINEIQLKSNEHGILMYPDLAGALETTVTDGELTKAEDSPDHIVIRLFDNQECSGSKPTGTAKSLAPPWWMNEYFGCFCILILIIAMIILCVVLRTYFPLHFARQSPS